MEFRDIKLEDKPLFERHFGGDLRSSFSFITCYIWSGGRRERAKILEMDESLIISWENEEGVFLQYPSGEGKKKAQTILTLCDYLEQNNMHPEFYYLNEKDVLELKSLLPDKFVFSFDRDNCDYLYLSEKLISLSGKKLHSKKNHLNSFKKKYNYSYRSIKKEDIPKCKELFDRWYADKDSDETYFTESRLATFRLMDEFEELGLTGGLIEVEGETVACAFGERISEKAAIIHIEFADKSYSGCYSAINQMFCQNEWSDCEYINREEDMGDEGLRKAKESYQPERLVNVYTARLKNR